MQENINIIDTIHYKTPNSLNVKSKEIKIKQKNYNT